MSRNEAPIIRRKRVDESEEGHGGVWKLAFADFMTAMMAFFLVMWLINSTSKETKAAIVQYFNPVQLVDATAAHKGLRDPKQAGEGKSARPGRPPDAQSTDLSEDKEAALKSEPMKALEEIAQKEPPPDLVDRSTPIASFAGDPFDRAPKSGTAPKEKIQEAAGDDRANARPASVSHDEKAKSASDLQSEIERIAAREIRRPRVDVKQTEEGLLISLTDEANFSMFAIGSIEPKPQLVRIIGQIGKILARRPGEVELRGHTDGRSYSGKSYDNWRLSSDRAVVLNYMLLRGGLSAARVGKIVGFADRRLNTPKDPLSPANRRIEILLRGAEP